MLPRELEELRRAQEELAYIVETGPVVTLRGTTDGFRITRLSPNMEEVLGISAEELLDRGWERFVHPDDVGPVLAELAKALTQDELELELRLLAGDGTHRWMRVFLRMSPPADAEAARDVIGWVWDETERKEAELALAESEEHLRTVLDTATDAYIAIDAEGAITEWNGQATAIFGWERAEVVGRPLHDTIIPPRYRAAHLAGLAHYKETGEGPVLFQRLELEGLHRDGHAVPVEITIWPLTRGGALYCHALLHDISERKRAEEALRESEESFRRLVESSPAAIVGVDLSGNVTMWNRAAEAVFGWTRAEVLDAHNPLVPPDLEHEFAESLRLMARGEAITNVETERVRKDGRRIDVILSSAPLRDRGGRTIGAVSVYSDVSERKRLQEQFVEAQKMTAVGRLAGGVAHDFNNLLTTIAGAAELLSEEGVSGEEMAEYVDLITTTTERAAVITDQLLALSEHRESEAAPLDVNDLVGGMHEILSHLVREDVTFDVVLSTTAPWVTAAREQIEQVVLNLVLNARDAVSEGGSVRIETTLERGRPGAGEDGWWVVLRVEDTGHGMDRGVQERALEPFFTTRTGRAGLGLAVVYGIVTSNGGTVTLTSAPGEGSIAEVRLPGVAAPAAREAPAGTSRGAPVVAGGGTVLLVEDEPALRSVVQRVLERQGYAVIAAGDGVEALALVDPAAPPVDVLVTDMVMPRMGGAALAERLRSWWPWLPVVYISGYTEVAPRTGDGSSDPSRYVRKPFTAAQLLDAVSGLVAVPGPGPQPDHP